MTISISRRAFSRHVLAAGIAACLTLGSAAAYDRSVLRIGYRRSSTLTALLRRDEALEKALAPLKVSVSWHEFTSGLPIMEALNAGQIDVSADVADTVPVFAQAAPARITYVAQEAASPSAQAILVPGDSPVKSVADLKGRKVAVTSLIFVLGGAVTVSALGYLASRRLAAPLLDARFRIPQGRRIDAPLVLGSAVFGIDWGPSGFCPGPAVAALATGALPVLVFVAAMALGMAAHRAFDRREAALPSPSRG